MLGPGSRLLVNECAMFKPSSLFHFPLHRAVLFLTAFALELYGGTVKLLLFCALHNVCISLNRCVHFMFVFFNFPALNC